MNIIACIKQVPASDAVIKIRADEKAVDLAEMEKINAKLYVVNPYDEFAVEEAVRTKEKFGGEVTVITMGAEKAVEALRTCLAMGADKAIHLKDPAFDG
ncbi:MAG: electron transfer flavoprotein subunit beta, partial [Nitrospirae bacterium]|nr:electron transfer flavoprotein subunit beta [Nitrospirota bacterium]